MIRHLAVLAVAGLLPLAGCCGGYAVVRTTFLQGAEPGPQGSTQAAADRAFVLHYSRLGEPPNSCGGDEQLIEDLRIQIPSLRVGQTYTIGQGGVVAMYTRAHTSAPDAQERALSIAGTVTIEEPPGPSGEGMEAELDIQITLATGEAVILNDTYAFHPHRDSALALTRPSTCF